MRGVWAGMGVNSLDNSILCISDVALGSCGEIKLSRTVGCLQCMYNKCILQCVIHYSRRKIPAEEDSRTEGPPGRTRELLLYLHVIPPSLTPKDMTGEGVRADGPI